MVILTHQPPFGNLPTLPGDPFAQGETPWYNNARQTVFLTTLL
jgi:hypothetical protein